MASSMPSMNHPPVADVAPDMTPCEPGEPSAPASMPSADSGPTSPPAAIARRTALVAGLAGVGAAALAACGSSGGSGHAAATRGAASTGSSVATNAAGGGSSSAGAAPSSAGASSSAAGAGSGGQTVATLADIKVGQAIAAKLDGNDVIVARPTAGTAACFSAICTHQGCTVQPNGAQLQCPCHGSVFNALTGAVEGGPAPSPLPKIAVTVQGGKVVSG